MKKILANKKLAAGSLFIFIYCLSILIEKRINSGVGIADMNFKLFSPYYLLFTILIPALLLLPIRLAPSSTYSKYIFEKQIILSKLINIATICIVGWLLLWLLMTKGGDLIFGQFKSDKAEAEKVAIPFIKKDSTVNARIGSVDSIEFHSARINNGNAEFHYTLHGIHAAIQVQILLNQSEKWVVDTLIIE